MSPKRLVAGFVVLGISVGAGIFLAETQSVRAHELNSGKEAYQPASGDLLLHDFQAPPAAARPWVLWYWMNGNVTEAGIRLDLEWMKRVGIAGANLHEASGGVPKIVEKPLAAYSPEWRSAFRYAIKLADAKGIEMSIHTSPGDSLTGNPSVTPAQAMKKLVWSETHVQGGRAFEGVLPAPPVTTGPFQNTKTRFPGSPAQFYGDTAVVAYRVSHAPPALDRAVVTSNAGAINAVRLNDGELLEPVSLPVQDGGAWVTFTYDRPQTIASAVLATPIPAANWAWPHPLAGELQVQLATGSYRTIARLDIALSPQVSVSFPPVSAKTFRVVLTEPERRLPLSWSPVPGAILPGKFGLLTPAKTLAISELSLHSVGRVNEFERKAGFTVAEDYYALDTPEAAANFPVSPADVEDLTGKMAADGLLKWAPPPGEWVVLRFGYSLTGATNGTAAPEVTGLEVDKLNRRHVRDYMDSYLDNYSKFLAPAFMGARGLSGIMHDSAEMWPQNWTEDMLEQFQQLRGYDPRPWLPVLTGVIVKSGAASDKFLWDFRRTIAQLTAENHYAEIAAASHVRGLKQYGEALEYYRPILGDDMQMRRYTDMPAGAMWMSYPFDKDPLPTFVGDVYGAASVAHLYGQNLAAAESFTSILQPWAHAPRHLKPIADLQFALGINRIIVLSSVHQPTEQAPGMSLGVAGQYFNRHETWGEEAGPWVTYLARSSHLLQQGRFFADVAYFYGEEAPLTTLADRGRLNDVPTGYAFDFVNAEALLELLQVRGKSLVVPSGMRYRVLQLGGSSNKMTLPVLRKIRSLVQDGAVVVGAAPLESPSLADDEVEFKGIKAELWGSDGKGRSFGRGRVYGTGTIEHALSSESIPPDFTYSNPQAHLMFLHRTLPDGELYFVHNRKNRDEIVETSFRVTGKAAELWHADTGVTEPASFRIEGGRTVVPLRLQAYDSVFLVFRRPALTQSHTTSAQLTEKIGTIDGPWTVSFQPGRGAPPVLEFTKLQSWSTHPAPGVKYFSGSAVYNKRISAPRSWFEPGARLVLDLGVVRELASVSLNGRSLGIVWKPPYTVDITQVLQPGENTLEVRVTNLWVNRLIGDQQPGAEKYTFTAVPTYEANAPLLPSGLLGPVALLKVNTGWVEQ